MDRLTSLAVFVRAVDLGSFTAAGAALHLSSQQVGKHIQELEARLGVRLLARTTRRQSLTDFGKVFYERARIILDEVAKTITREIPASVTADLSWRRGVFDLEMVVGNDVTKIESGAVTTQDEVTK